MNWKDGHTYRQLYIYLSSAGIEGQNQLKQCRIINLVRGYQSELLKL